ncbi:MAG TPA: hypothetical protein PKG52_00725 [bacterium]|nr:hypothetical protein [bacterium]HPS28964.1 hypothetical protein [bacterium]
MKKIIAVLIMLLPMMAFAAIGPNVSQVNGEELKWEEGAWDYFIMFKTLIDQVTGAATTGSGNPQADTCLDINVGSTFTLTPDHVPIDTNIDRAFLIWVAAQDPANFSGPTDNSVTLSFTNSTNQAVALSTEVTSNVSGNLFTPPSFDYEAVNDNLNSEGVYTYRVDVTDFMKQIIELGAVNDITMTGEALYGDYNVKGMECTNDQTYVNSSGMVGAWALVFVYTSEKVTPKKIYFYNGLEAYRFEEGFVTVSGFELPNEAEVRLSMIVAEGDPGLASAFDESYQAAPPEALALKGQSATDFVLLWNDCNPPKYTPLNYTEVYNSISSMYLWGADIPTCIGGDPNNPNPDLLEYAIDADTFLLKAKDFPFDSHLKKGDTSFSLKIGANQDQVYTNLLVVSVDTKAPKFDIPVNPDTPDGREKNFCSCSTDADAVCFDRPFYYLIKIQNWGENIAENVTLQDALPNTIEYVSGTTEIAKNFKDGLGIDWTKVDDVDGKFPFSSSVKISDLMGYCDKTTFECPDTIMVRFVVTPKADLAKHETIKNSAVISDSGNIPYSTNSNIALRLKNGECPAITTCNLPPKSECGGVAGGGKACEDKGDCEDGQICVDRQCVDDTASGDLTDGAEITFGAGPNSPDPDTTMVIPSPKSNIVAGQFYLYSEGNKGKFYNFSGLIAKFTFDSDVSVSNLRLIVDGNGNGRLDSDEKELAKINSLSNQNYAEFNIMNIADRLIPAGQKTYFLIVADASTNITSGRGGSFVSQIENAEAIRIEDNGTAKVTGTGVKFATFRFEPSKGFIFTKGENDPNVPVFSMINNDNAILQVRTKSMEGGDAIKSIPVKAPVGFVKFGEGIKSVTLLLDNDKDGMHSSSDTVIQKITTFDSPSTVTFSNLDSVLTYSAGEEKYLLFKCEFAMKDGEKAKIQIPRITITTEKEIAELPVSSKEIDYVCDKSDPNACTDTDIKKDDGCSITTVEDSSFSFAGLLIVALISIFLFRFRKD